MHGKFAPFVDVWAPSKLEITAPGKIPSLDIAHVNDVQIPVDLPDAPRTGDGRPKLGAAAGIMFSRLMTSCEAKLLGE